MPDSAQFKALTITKRGRRLWVNMTYAVEQAQPNASGLAVGMDMGVTNRIALSTGEAITRRNKPNDKMVRAQQRLSRCRKGSRSWRERRAVLSNAQDRERIQEPERMSSDHDRPSQALRPDCRREPSDPEHDGLG